MMSVLNRKGHRVARVWAFAVFALFHLGCGLRAQERDQAVKKCFQLNGEDNHIYREVDEAPEFPGGLNALIKYLNEKCRIFYPLAAGELMPLGLVVMEVVIEKDGTLSSGPVVYSAHSDLVCLVAPVLRDMPRWAPSRIGGKPVRTFFSLPMRFRYG